MGTGCKDTYLWEAHLDHARYNLETEMSHIRGGEGTIPDFHAFVHVVLQLDASLSMYQVTIYASSKTRLQCHLYH